jgi:hypothetical protein
MRSSESSLRRARNSSAPQTRASVPFLLRGGGIPLGQVGYSSRNEVWASVDPEDAKRPKALEPGEALYLFSGILDDRRREHPLTTKHRAYGLFAHAHFWQDQWNRFQHRSFWEGSLSLWPDTAGGNPQTQQAWAFALVLAWARGITTQAITRELQLSPGSVRARGLKTIAESMWKELASPVGLGNVPHGGRLPRVVADHEHADYPFVFLSVSNQGIGWPAQAYDVLTMALRYLDHGTELPSADLDQVMRLGLSKGSDHNVRLAVQAVAQIEAREGIAEGAHVVRADGVERGPHQRASA